MTTKTPLLLAPAAALLVAMIAASAAAGTGDAAREIAAGFEAHGMDPDRAACFGARIAAELSDAEEPAAMRILREAATPDDIQLGVIRAGGSMVEAFTFADASCPRG